MTVTLIIAANVLLALTIVGALAFVMGTATSLRTRT
jgi:hypothetical protein